MNLDQFLEIIKKSDSHELVAQFCYKKNVHAIPDDDKYKRYLDAIKKDYPSAEHITIMGSGNWAYSLNPKKNFSLYSERSDIDVVIICEKTFNQTWDELRTYHRKNYYLLNTSDRDRLRRNGENVYSGFVTPKWIPDRKSKLRFQYEVNTNKYADENVQYREVNMMYFRNINEVIDYYVRGFSQAKNK